MPQQTAVRRRLLPLALASALALATTAGPSGSAAGAAPAARDTNPLAAAGDPRPGIYQVWGSDRDATLPWVRGGQIVVQWNAVNPARGRFDWSSLAAKIASYRAMGRPATVQINADVKPEWVWSSVARCGTQGKWVVPQFWDPRYLQFQQELIASLAQFLKASPDRSWVTLVRASPNAIGTELVDASGRTCSPTPSGHRDPRPFSKDLAAAYWRDVMTAYRTSLTPAINLAVRANTFLEMKAPHTWIGLDDSWLFGTASDVDPNPTREKMDLLAISTARVGTTRAYWEPINYGGKANLVSWNYWRLLHELNKGVAYIAVYGQQIRDGAQPEYRAGFDFANRYAGYADRPATSPGAWVALKQGVGATAGNFGNHLVQLDPAGTSTPLESARGTRMVGPQDQRFGRYARQLTGGTTRGRTSFALTPAFRDGVAGRATSLAVTYLDAGSGSFSLRWGAGPGAVTTVQKSGTGRWRRAVVPVPGSAYAAGLGGGADLVLEVPSGGGSTAFHMVEVAVDGR